jgi:hypothetical protein
VHIELCGSRVPLCHRVVRASLGGLGGSPSCYMSIVCWEGSPYVLYGAWVTLFCAFLDPQNLCGMCRRLYGELDIGSAMHVAWMYFAVANSL